MHKSLEENNIAFFFAQKYHSAMKYVAPVRKQLGIRTVFNILGPLTNPGKVCQMVLGVFSEEYVEKIATALVKLGVTDALVVYGVDGLDEISACGKTVAAEVRDGKIKKYEITPESFGLKSCTKEELLGGTPEENAQITRDIINGRGTDAQNTAVALNAGACIYVAKEGVSLEQAINEAKEIIKSGKAQKTLERFIEVTNE